MHRARAEGGGLTRAPAGQGAVPSMEEGRQQNAGYLNSPIRTPWCSSPASSSYLRGQRV